MSERKEKIISIRVPVDLHRRASMKLAETGQKFQGLLEGFLEEWVEGRASEPAQAPASGHRSHKREYELLDRILSADPKTAAAVRTNLELLAELAAARAAAKQTEGRLREFRDGLVSAYRPPRDGIERRRRRCWQASLPDGARLRLEGLDCPVLVAPHGLPHCLDSLRRSLGFSCPVGEPEPCLAASAWLLGAA